MHCLRNEQCPCTYDLNKEVIAGWQCIQCQGSWNQTIENSWLRVKGKGEHAVQVV